MVQLKHLSHGIIKKTNFYSANNIKIPVNVKGIKQVYNQNNITIRTDGRIAYLYYEQTRALNTGETSITSIDNNYAPIGFVEDFVMAWNCKCRLAGNTFSIINMSGKNITSTIIKAWMTYMLANPLY